MVLWIFKYVNLTLSSSILLRLFRTIAAFINFQIIPKGIDCCIQWLSFFSWNFFYIVCLFLCDNKTSMNLHFIWLDGLTIFGRPLTSWNCPKSFGIGTSGGGCWQKHGHSAIIKYLISGQLVLKWKHEDVIILGNVLRWKILVLTFVQSKNQMLTFVQAKI